MKLCKNPKILASRLQRPVATRNDVIAKKIASGLFQNLSGRPEDWTVSGPCHLSTYMQFLRITLIGGPAGRAGWRAVFPNEKRDNRLYDYSS